MNSSAGKTGKRAWYAELIRTHIGVAVEGTIVINCVSVEGVVVGGSCAIAITQPGVLAQAAPEGRRSRRGDTLDRGYEYHTAHSDCQSCLAAHQCSSTGRSNSSSLSATCWSTLRIFFTHTLNLRQDSETFYFGLSLLVTGLELLIPTVSTWNSKAIELKAAPKSETSRALSFFNSIAFDISNFFTAF
jgi:hypothetical protein